MRSVRRRLSDASTPAAMLFAERPLPSAPGAAPTLVMSTIRSRCAGERFSQLPMMVSDSPPWLPGTQREYTSAVSMALRPESTKRSSRRKAVGSSTVQPKTLPPRTSGAMRRPERPRVRRPMEGLKRGGRERIAVLRPAGIQAALEPAHALRGRAVREGLRHHAPLRLFLQTVVADRRRGVERLGDIARIELVHRAGVVSPYAGIAVGLELHAHRD